MRDARVFAGMAVLAPSMVTAAADVDEGFGYPNGRTRMVAPPELVPGTVHDPRSQ
jgi:hypothetical protein